MSLHSNIIKLQDYLETLTGVSTSGGFLGATVTPQTGSQFIVRPMAAFTDPDTRRDGSDLKVAFMLVADSPSALIKDLSLKLDSLREAFNGGDQSLCVCDLDRKCTLYTLGSDFQIGDIEGFQESRISSTVSFCKILLAFKVCALG